MPAGGQVIPIGRGQATSVGWGSGVSMGGDCSRVDGTVDQTNVVGGGSPLPGVATKTVPVGNNNVGSPSPVSTGPLPDDVGVDERMVDGDGDVDAVRRFSGHRRGTPGCGWGFVR